MTTTTAPDVAADRARAAFRRGRTQPLEWRRQQLRALDTLLRENSDAIEAAVHADLGRHGVETYLAEIGEVRAGIKDTLRNLNRWTATRRVKIPVHLLPASARIRREPLGAVLVISPWNYPINLLFLPLVGAIAAGNAVVLKPSEVAAETAALIARLVPRYLDDEAVQVVTGGIEETTELLALPWDHIFYTGNGQVGRVILEAAARHLTPVTLELGGKSPAWVDPSADLKSAAHWLAWGKFYNAGQTCVAPDYVLTTPQVVPVLLDHLARELTSMYGADPHRSKDYGRIVNTRHFDRLAALLGSGEVAIGGHTVRDERYIAPTVLRDVPLDAPVMAEEIFGPILPVLSVADLDEAIKVVNDRPKPLALYAFCRDTARTEHLIAQTSSGSVGINSVFMQLGVPALPFGGVGASGMGAYHGEHSIRTFSHERAIFAKNRGPNLTAIGQPPFTPFKERLLGR